MRSAILIVLVAPFACSSNSADSSQVDSAIEGSNTGSNPGSSSPTPTMTALDCVTYTFTEQGSNSKIVTTTSYAQLDVDLQSSFSIVQCGFRIDGVGTGGAQACPAGYTCTTTGTPPTGSNDCYWTSSVSTLGGKAYVQCSTSTTSFNSMGVMVGSSSSGYDSTSLATW